MYTELSESSKIIKEFSRFAHKYDQYSTIQAKVATTLVKKLSESNYSSILDIGCGSGEVYKNFKARNISIEHFIALDSAKIMLDIHPSSPNISKVCANFNDVNFLDNIFQKKIDIIIASSSLQWSKDLDFTLEKLSVQSEVLYAAIFTSGTFKTLHKIAGVTSPIYDVKAIQEIVRKYYNRVTFTLHQYSLDFKTTRDMFKYIKQSGVSSGEKKLNYKQTKQLMEEYPLNYLEFEVLFVEAKYSQ